MASGNQSGASGSRLNREFLLNFHRKRKVHPVNCCEVSGDYLEDVPEEEKGYRPGVALVSQEWQPEVYLMKARPLWGDAEYFEEAERIIKRRYIEAQRKNLVDPMDDAIRETNKEGG